MPADRRKLLTFRADLESGEGEIKSWPRFGELTPLMRMDILKDCMINLEE